MLGTITLLLAAILAIFYHESFAEATTKENDPAKKTRLATQITRLWDVSQKLIKKKNYNSAEKALLTILRVDEKNASAYNRLGILYAKQQQYNDAIECFEIAQSLEPSASSLHNVGLIYYEVGNFEKAEQAFKQALGIEENIATRHIAYAKVLEAIGETTRVISELERAVELEPNPQSVRLLASTLRAAGEIERSDKLEKIAAKMIERGERQRIKQPNKISV